MREVEPETIFLAEAFTRPAMMTTLGKVGLQPVLHVLHVEEHALGAGRVRRRAASPGRRFYRPNFFANTPDILHEYLQEGGRPAFEARLVLAATLSPSYGIYSGFESFENVPVTPGSEEYLDSEKYEVKARALDGPLLPLVQRLNEIRRDNPALQYFENVELLETESEHLFAFAKRWERQYRGRGDEPRPDSRARGPRASSRRTSACRRRSPARSSYRRAVRVAASAATSSASARASHIVRVNR